MRGKIIHGQGRRSGITPEYRAYKQARQRCLNSHNPDFHHYGGRGIQFLFQSFDEFFAELGPKPEPKRLYSVDRKNNSGHYEPGNVRWATLSEQRSNRRKFKLPKNNKSGILQRKSGSWMAYGYRNKKNHRLGTFATKEEAISARLKWEENK